MIPYMMTFIISILVCLAAEWTDRRGHSSARIFYAGAVMVPVFLAGARDYSVGTDIATYGNYVFQAASGARSLTAFLRSRRDIDLLYKALAFAVSRFTNNPHWFYFVTALIICGCTMLGLLYYRRWCSVTLAWACFLFLFYGDTLNTMRQCIALAIVFAAFPLFLEKKYVPYAVLTVAAVLFHATGLLSLALPFFYFFLQKMPARWVQFFLIVGFMGVILTYSPVLQAVLKTGLLPRKFARYVANGLAFALNPTMLRLPFLLPVILYYDRFCGLDRDGEETGIGGGSLTGMLIALMLLLEICTVQLRSVRPALYRVSYYFGYYRFIAYSRLARILRRDNRALFILALFLYLAALWYYQNVIQGNNQIYPYIYAPGWYVRRIPVLIE